MQCQTGARVRVRHRSSTSGRRRESDTSVSYVLENDPPGWLLYHTLSIKYTPPVNTPWPSTSPTVHLYPAQMPEEHERYRWGLKDWLRLSVHWVTAGIKDGGQCIHSSKSWSLISTDTYHSSISLDFQVLLPPQFRLQTTTLRWSVELNGKKYIL